MPPLCFLDLSGGSVALGKTFDCMIGKQEYAHTGSWYWLLITQHNLGLVKQLFLKDSGQAFSAILLQR
jgi:hypothetical protein